MIEQKHHYHELPCESQIILGALPKAFTKYWIDRFPRLISHSYHSLETCSLEHTFTGYYPKGYRFSKPNYFFEITEDFKPFDASINKARDSPKRFNQGFNKDFRKPMYDYPNFVMDRKPRMKPMQNGMPLINDGNGNLSNFPRPNKKGSYNFQRISGTLKSIMNEITRNSDNPSRSSEDSDANESKINAENNTVIETEQNVVAPKTVLENEENCDIKNENVDQSIKIDENEKVEIDTVTPIVPIKSKGKGKKQKHDSGDRASNRDPDVDDDGFVKVRHRGNSKKQREIQNENVQWIVPGRDRKESK